MKQSIKTISYQKLAEATGLSTRSLRDIQRRDPRFPTPIQIGRRKIAYFEHEVYAWLETRRIAEEGAR